MSEYYSIYTSAKCPSCKKLVKLLRWKGLDFEKISIRHNNEGIKFLQEQNLYTVPQLFENGKLIGGYEDALKHLNQKG